MKLGPWVAPDPLYPPNFFQIAFDVARWFTVSGATPAELRAVCTVCGASSPLKLDLRKKRQALPVFVEHAPGCALWFALLRVSCAHLS